MTRNELGSPYVFLSYSKESKSLTESLARDLGRQGISAWWDTRLLPGDSFREEIQEKIDNAEAVVVIWTLESIKSRWVRAEADRGLYQDKLINTHADDVTPRVHIPLPFSEQNSVNIANRAAIIAAIRKIGLSTSSTIASVTPSYSSAEIRDEIALEHWRGIKDLPDPAPLIAFLVEFADSKLAGPARRRLADLEEITWRDLAEKPTIGALDTFDVNFPNSKHAVASRELRQQIRAEQCWEALKLSEDPAVLRGYPAEFGNTKFAVLARQRLADLERKAWAQLIKHPTLASVTAFEALYPDGAYAKAARQLRTEILAIEAWGRVKDARDPAPVRKFLSMFGAHERLAQLARTKLSALQQQAWADLPNPLTVTALDSFRTRFPNEEDQNAAEALRPQLEAERAWRAIRNSTDPGSIVAYLASQTDQRFASLAEMRLDELADKAWHQLPKPKAIRDLPDVLNAISSFLDQYPQGTRAKQAGAERDRLSEDIDLLQSLGWAATEHTLRRALSAARSQNTAELLKALLDRPPKTSIRLRDPQRVRVAETVELGNEPPLRDPWLGRPVDAELLRRVAAVVILGAAGLACLLMIAKALASWAS